VSSSIDDLPSAPSAPTEPRRWLWVAAALVATASVGAALAPYLAIHHPLLLLALTPWPRHMILVAPLVPMVPFVVVTTLRAFAGCAVGFEVGSRYGKDGLGLLEARSARLGRVLTAVERVFRRASVPLMMIAPGPLTGALAGIGGLRRVIAFPALLLGQTGWVYLTYRLGDFLKPWTAPVMAFIARYLLESTLICAALVLAYQWLARRRRQRHLEARPQISAD
jgi:hypothetical protein